MSRPLSEKKKQLNKNQSKIIIIQKDRINSSKIKGSILTLEQGRYKVQLNMGENSKNLNKTKIDNTLKSIEKSVELLKSQKINKKDIPDFIELRSNTKEELDSYKELENKKNENENEQLEKNNSIFKFSDCDKKSIQNEHEETKCIKNNILNEININNNNNLYNEYNYNDESKEHKQIIPRFIIFEDNYSENDRFNFYEICLICERTFPSQKIYLPECKKHILCRKCVKNYYEDLIEQGERKIKCPVYYCKYEFNILKLKKIISEQHFNLLNGKPNIFSQSSTLKIQERYNINPQGKETLKLYTQKHVIDINSNQNFFMFNKAKNQFCPKCNESSLFSKIGGHFIKCLNCFHKICKYCLKDYDISHMDINNEDHCKVYFRFENDDIKKRNCFLNYLIELFFVLASFYFLFVGGFKYIKNCVKWFFCVKDNSNCFLWIIVYFFTMIFFICSIPVILIGLPYFPIFIAIFN